MIKSLSGLILAAGLAASASAGAATYDIGVLNYEGATPFGLYQVNGAFSDTIDFTITQRFDAVEFGVGTLDFGLNAPPFGTSPFEGINMNSLTLTVYNSNNVELGRGTVASPLALLDMHGGNYYAVISGTTFGTAGGEYGGAMLVTAVPEASTWSMMLAGLGMLGYVATRRKAGRG